jgi:hypothetical protein
MIEKATRRDAMIGAGAGLPAGAVGPARIAQAQQDRSANGADRPSTADGLRSGHQAREMA